METVIELSKVSKKFGDKVIYDQVSLKIQKGETVGFVGSNGSGKSVLFQLLTGLLPADSGQIRINGDLLGKDRDFPDQVGALINHPGYIDFASGFKNLQLLAAIKNTIGDEEIRKTMAMVGLDDRDRTPVKKYSMGMKQKLGIAQAIMENQQLIILDEPFNALDYQTNREIMEVLQTIRQEGKTLLLTSHQQDYLDKLCDTIYCIHEHKILPFTKDLQDQYFRQ